MKILLAYYGSSVATTARFRDLAASAPPGMVVVPFPTALKGRRRKLSWVDLDESWRRREPALVRMHRALLEAADGCDVLLHYNGLNIHPEILPALPTFNVYCCFDDPESSHRVSAPVAADFDAVLYGNIASGPQYAGWGCRRAAHLPILVAPGDVPDVGAAETVLAGERDVDVVLCCGYARWRRRRLEGLRAAFPEARCHGAGWPGGPIDTERMHKLYRRSRVGWNVHNSTGPINLRLFALAAWGVLPVCDNKTGLGRLFELGREAVGFDTIPEAIELTRYYLAHEDERRAIAEAASRRFWRDYTASAAWTSIHRRIAAWMADGKRATGDGRRERLRLDDAPVSVLATDPARLARPLIRRVRRFAGRTGGRIAAGIDRIRFGSAATEHDERLYTGQRVPWAGGRRARSAKLARGLVRGGVADDPNHRAAALWALTSLIGPARRIAVVAEDPDPFLALAGIDPARALHRVAPDGGDRAGGESGEVDLVIGIEVPMARGPLREWLARWTPCADRLLLYGRPIEDRDGRTGVRLGPGELHETLSRDFPQVGLGFMPDPLVPWVEPLDGPSRVTPVFAICCRS